MAWLHSNGVFMDVNAEVKETIFSWSCVSPSYYL